RRPRARSGHRGVGRPRHQQGLTVDVRYSTLRYMRGSRPLPSASLHIVLALLEGEKHGYALMGDVERISDAAIKMGPGTLYGTLKRLLGDGFIEETTARNDPDVSEERRRYYRLTAEGEQVASAEL